MASLRNLTKLFIEFKKQLECVDEATEASLMFDRMHWASLSEAITNVTRRDNDGTVKYGLKNTLFYLLMSSADILEGVALTDTKSTRAADELAHFKKVLKHHENIICTSEEVGCPSSVSGSIDSRCYDITDTKSMY